MTEKLFEKVKSLLEELVTMIDSYSGISVSAEFDSFNESITHPDGEESYADILSAKPRLSEQIGSIWANGNSMPLLLTEMISCL